MIRYRNIFKAFDEPVLSGVDLTVDEGEMFGLFGPSGTGKSVLLKTTIGLIVPDRGDVFLKGQSVFFGDHDALDRVRRQVGYVFQHSALFDSMTVFDNVCMGIPEKELQRISRREAGKRAWEALEIVNLDPRMVL
ncbi:MAG: ATP-binding cassette domain-containing protein, partial [Longimicrobiales bacterium]|nr:ATP-binding cassette domain-containing protein [Longimicrobiales bacterium]